MFDIEYNPETLKRISEMEEIFDKANKLIKLRPKDVEGYLPEIEKLKNYYESKLWKDDFALEELGMLPSRLKRGVLSEDGIYNMLEDVKEIVGEAALYKTDYEAAAQYWTKKDKPDGRLIRGHAKALIEEFINSHNTCALATANHCMVRNTPIEYNFLDGCFYFFSEGGLKFKCLKDNKKVGIAIFEPYGGFGQLKSLQVEGSAHMIPPFCEEYLKILDHKKIPVEAMKKLPQPMHLIKVIPTTFDYLDSDLKKDGFSSRQHFKVVGDKGLI